MNILPKKRAGRPPVIQGGSAVLSAHVPIEHRAILAAEANEKHWSVAEVVRMALAQYVNGKQVPAK